MKILESRFVIFALRWILGGIFIYAGATKLCSPQNFSDSIASFAILPNCLINLMSLGLPPFEILAGLAIVTGIQRRPALLGIAFLTTIFIVALGSALVRGFPVDCGCFGSGKPSLLGNWIFFGRDIPILAMAILLYFLESRDERQFL